MANPSPNWQSSSNSSQWITQAQPVARLPEDEDNFERNWSWNSGNAQGTVHESRQSWTTISQASTAQVITTFSAPPMPMTPAIAMPVMQSMLPTMPSMDDFHQQSQQMMNNFHQNALDSHSRMVEDMNRNMSMSAMSMQSSYSQPQQQVAYHSSSTSLAPVQQQITYHSSSHSSPPVQQQPAQIHYTQNVFHQAPPQSQPQQLQVSSQNRIAGHNERFQVIKETRDNDMSDINEQGAAMKTAIRELEQQVKHLASQKRQDDSSQRQIRDLQDQIAAAARQQLEDARRHYAEMEELRRSKKLAPQQQAPGLDMDALRKVILETQAKQTSAADVQRAVEEAVARRLVGVARREDLEAASSSMQKALSKVPQGASEEQVQNAFGRELNKIVERVERHQRREIEAASPPQQQPWSRPQPEFTVEEIDEANQVAAPAPVQPYQTAYQAQPTPSAPTQVQYAPQRAPVVHSAAPPTMSAPQPPTTKKLPVVATPVSGALARVKKSGDPSPKRHPAPLAAPTQPIVARAAPAPSARPSRAVAGVKKHHLTAPTTMPMMPQNDPVQTSAANTAPQSGALARVKQSNAVARPGSVPAAPVPQAAPTSGAIARVKKPSAPEPVPAPQPASSTAMVRPGSRPTATVPAAQQAVQQTPSAPAARPVRQLMPPPAPAVAPLRAIVRQSKDVAKKPR
nr:hypothetical protein B0A51_12862 [Rachicladosporium sp. CCFEE 5018]